MEGWGPDPEGCEGEDDDELVNVDAVAVQDTQDTDDL